MEALAPGLGGHPPGALALPRQRPGGADGVAAVTYVKTTYGDLIDGILYRAIGSALMMVGVLLIVKVVMHVDSGTAARTSR